MIPADGSVAIRSLTKLSDGRLGMLKATAGGSHFPPSTIVIYNPATGEFSEFGKDIFAESIIGQFNNKLVLSAAIKSQYKIMIADTVRLETRIIEPEMPIASLLAHAVYENYVLVEESCLNQGSQVSLIDIDDEKTSFKSVAAGPPQVCPALMEIKDIRVEIKRLNEDADYVAIMPPEEKRSGATIVVPHGGPNGTFVTSYSPLVGLFAMAGYAVLGINYTGSIGYGREAITKLEGKIGVLDVADVISCMENFRQDKPEYVSKGFFYCSGSHGGYIGAMITAKYPNLLKACVLRNPVIDLPAMSLVTDIKDWTFGQTGLPFDLINAKPSTEGQLIAMRHFSPSTYVSSVRTPTLIILGEKDARVPPSQGMAWYYWLKSLPGVAVEMLVFSDADHSLDTPIAEKNGMVSILDFFSKYMD